MSDDHGQSQLKEFLSGAKGKHILFAGLGNLLRKDDGVGATITRNILKSDHITPLTVEVSLENYIGKINSLNPDCLVFIDCTEMQRFPGYYTLLSPDRIPDHTFNTHNISLSRLNEFFDMPTLVLAIQPGDISFGEELTPMVEASAGEIINVINHPDGHFSQIGKSGSKLSLCKDRHKTKPTDY